MLLYETYIKYFLINHPDLVQNANLVVISRFASYFKQMDHALGGLGIIINQPGKH
jgi:hypothetical protein